MLNYIIFAGISFLFGIFAREIIEIIERRKRYEDIKKQNNESYRD